MIDDAAEQRIREIHDAAFDSSTGHAILDAIRAAWTEATEAAALKCESEKTKLYDSVSGSQTHAYNDACNDCAAAIRGGKL